MNKLAFSGKQGLILLVSVLGSAVGRHLRPHVSVSEFGLAV